jgi:hypothetical protein
MKKRFIFYCVFLLLTNALLGQNKKQLYQRFGGGNFTNGEVNETVLQQINILKLYNSGSCRINLYPYEYWDFDFNVPSFAADSIITLLLKDAIEPIILFEHYGHYTEPIGGYTRWYDIGHAYAARYKANSSFLLSKGIVNRGIKLYEAFNEPDLQDELTQIPFTTYHNTLEGLCDGVHSIDLTMKVFPGGFASENAYNIHDLNGYGTAIADLFNNGKLAGLDLHTYTGNQFAPLIVDDTGVDYYQFSPQADFEEIKEACGITANIDFIATEYNFNRELTGITVAQTAERLLTCYWANAAVTGNDGVSPNTQIFLAWNLFNTEVEDPPYGFCKTFSPYTPNLSGQTLLMVQNLIKGYELDAVQKPEGLIWLHNGSNKLLVWQNYNSWSNIADTQITIDNLSPNTTQIKVYDYTGFTTAVPTFGHSTVQINVPKKQSTYMFLIEDSRTIPIELLNFTASAQTTENELIWQTVSESNCKGFDIQRSSDTKAWEEMGFVQGQGYSKTLQKYKFSDKSPLSISYYRLRLIDFDGKETISKTIDIVRNEGFDAHLFPNPTSGKINIEAIETPPYKVRVINNLGQILITETLENNEIDISRLPEGLYYIELASGVKRIQKKVFKN